MKIRISKKGFQSVKEWNPTYKHHHLPLWMKKIVRIVAIKKGDWTPGMDPECYFLHDREFHGLWDHWGSIIGASERSLITQPYGEHDEKAEKFAEEHGCVLETIIPGPWHPKTHLYIFTKRQKN
jgi:hypothetical protein